MSRGACQPTGAPFAFSWRRIAHHTRCAAVTCGRRERQSASSRRSTSGKRAHANFKAFARFRLHRSFAAAMFRAISTLPKETGPPRPCPKGGSVARVEATGRVSGLPFGEVSATTQGCRPYGHESSSAGESSPAGLAHSQRSSRFPGNRATRDMDARGRQERAVAAFTEDLLWSIHALFV